MLSILLLVLLPLQSSWTVAATYDEHEPHTQDQHFGHHDGFHYAAAADASDADGSVSTFDTDSGHSHGHLAAALLSMPIMPTLAAASPSTPCSKAHWLPRSLSPPERPQWARHA